MKAQAQADAQVNLCKYQPNGFCQKCIQQSGHGSVTEWRLMNPDGPHCRFLPQFWCLFYGIKQPYRLLYYCYRQHGMQNDTACQLQLVTQRVVQKKVPNIKVKTDILDIRAMERYVHNHAQLVRSKWYPLTISK